MSNPGPVRAQKAISLYGAGDQVARAADRLEGRAPFEALSSRLTDLAAELSDCASELRALGESIEPDEERLAVIGERRQQLTELRRKYGDTIDDVIAFRAEVGERLDELLAHKEELNETIEGQVRSRVAAYGLELASIGVKDIILPGEMKAILNRVVEAEKEAQANLIRRREETAATR